MGRKQIRKNSASSKKVMLLITAGLILFLVSFVFKKCADSSGKRIYAEVVQEVNDSPVLQSEEENNVSIADGDSSETRSRYEQNTRDETNRSFFIRTFNWFLRKTIFFILIAAILFLFFSTQSLIQKNKELSNELRDIKQKLNFTPSWSNLQERFLEKSKYDQFISDFEKRFGANKNNDSIDSRTHGGNLNPLVGSLEQVETNEQKFFPAPNTGGYFQGSTGSKQFRPGEHIFLFEFIGANPGQAKYRVFEDRDSMKYAINYNDAILKAACEIENLMFQNPSKIINVTSGEVIKQGDDWKIVKKAVIRYG